MSSLRVRKACAASIAAFALGAACGLGAPPADRDFDAMATAAYRGELARARERGFLDRDPAFVERSRRIFASLVAAASRDRPEVAAWSWEIHTSEDPAVAAYCLAGGRVVLGAPFTRRLALDDAELAMLLAHEIAHALAGHRRAKPDASDSMEADAAAQLKVAALASAQEDEADWLGMTIAHRAGWPLDGLIAFFDKVAALQPAGTFASTHASASERAAAARRFADSLRP